MMRSFGQARDGFVRALDCAKANKDIVSTVKQTFNIGLCESRSSKWPEALTWFEKANQMVAKEAVLVGGLEPYTVCAIGYTKQMQRAYRVGAAVPRDGPSLTFQAPLGSHISTKGKRLTEGALPGGCDPLQAGAGRR
jgi:hypothetical protein